MRTDDIRIGDTLKLKKDNPYGMGPALVTVTAIREQLGYKTSWIISDQYSNGTGGAAAFRPSDFSGKV